MIYRTKDGDVLDALCKAHYGDTLYTMDAVLAHNPSLAARGPVLSAGILITFPDIDDGAQDAPVLQVKLWE